MIPASAPPGALRSFLSPNSYHDQTDRSKSRSKNSSDHFDDASTVLDESGSLGPFLDATIAKAKQIENTEIHSKNHVTPVKEIKHEI